MGLYDALIAEIVDRQQVANTRAALKTEAGRILYAASWDKEIESAFRDAKVDYARGALTTDEYLELIELWRRISAAAHGEDEEES